MRESSNPQNEQLKLNTDKCQKTHSNGKIKPTEMSHQVLNKPVSSHQCLQFHNELPPKKRNTMWKRGIENAGVVTTKQIMAQCHLE